MDVFSTELGIRPSFLKTSEFWGGLNPPKPPAQYAAVCGCSGVPRNFVRGGEGVQQLQLRTEGRENGDLGAIAPSQGFCSICK
jgi:hypothetical protein